MRWEFQNSNLEGKKKRNRVKCEIYFPKCCYNEQNYSYLKLIYHSCLLNNFIKFLCAILNSIHVLAFVHGCVIDNYLIYCHRHATPMKISLEKLWFMKINYASWKFLFFTLHHYTFLLAFYLDCCNILEIWVSFLIRRILIFILSFFNLFF